MILFGLNTTASSLTIDSTLSTISKKEKWCIDSIYKVKRHLEIEVLYIGTLLNPGGSVGIGLPFHETVIHKIRGGKLKKWKETQSLVFITGFYSDPNIHTALNIHFFYKRKKKFENGWFTCAYYGLGTSRTYLVGNTYTVSDNGTVSSIKHNGYWYFSPSLSAGTGYDFRYKYNLPFDLHMDIGVQFMMPYANNIFLRPRIELGICYDLSTIYGFITHKIK